MSRWRLIVSYHVPGLGTCTRTSWHLFNWTARFAGWVACMENSEARTRVDYRPLSVKK